MASLRSQETLQKEYDLQAKQTVRINYELEGRQDPDYRSKLEDAAVFANVLRKYAPEGSMVVLYHRPEIAFTGEGDGYAVGLHITPACWWFKINNSVNYTLEPGEKIGPARMIKKLWDIVIPQLPEGYIIRGKTNPKDSPEEMAARVKVLEALGFSAPQVNDEVYGIIRDKKMHPISLEEFKEITGIHPMDFVDQPFNTRTVKWPGA